jgi:hypothetical protein
VSVRYKRLTVGSQIKPIFSGQLGLKVGQQSGAFVAEVTTFIRPLAAHRAARICPQLVKKSGKLCLGSR